VDVLISTLSPNQPIGESDFVKTFRSREGSTPSLFTVEPTTGVYRMSSGMRFVPDFSYDNAPPANMIVAPGGHGSMNIPALRQNGTIDYIKKVATAQGWRPTSAVTQPLSIAMNGNGKLRNVAQSNNR
jgi:hypothetical protein